MGEHLEADDEVQNVASEVRVIGDAAVHVRGVAASDDEWVYLDLDPGRYAWGDFAWRFRVRRLTAFRELQFGFRYQDFFNRYRYRFEEDRVWYDQVANGQFHNGLSSAHFDMVLGEWYEVCIVACGNRFQCIVDGHLLLDDFDPVDRFPKGSVAMILWQDSSDVAISAEVCNLAIISIAP